MQIQISRPSKTKRNRPQLLSLILMYSPGLSLQIMYRIQVPHQPKVQALVVSKLYPAYARSTPRRMELSHSTPPRYSYLRYSVLSSKSSQPQQFSISNMSGYDSALSIFSYVFLLCLIPSFCTLVLLNSRPLLYYSNWDPSKGSCRLQLGSFHLSFAY